ncbi:MAG: hypothetical protein GY850_14810 [bacterium]|nr:hypothetical protein [bacterium]
MKTKGSQEELLDDYLENRIGLNKKSGIESHFSECSRCLDEFLTTNTITQNRDELAVDPVPEHVTETAVKLVAKLVSRPQDSYKPRSYQFFNRLFSRISEHIKLIRYNKNRFAPVRGSSRSETSDFYRVRKMFKEIVAEIEIEKSGQQIAAIRTTLINGFGDEIDFRVTLQNSNNREIASHRIVGKFAIFENIPFGHYSLVFMQTGKKIGTYSFEIKESA